MPGLRSADSYRTWADLRDVLFEIVSAISSLHLLYHVRGFTKYGWKSLKGFVRFLCFDFHRLSLILSRV